MPTNKNIDLKIHEIPSKDIWDYMVENNLVNEDEFYLLHDENLSDVEEHTHEISDVNGLSTSLDNKLNKTGDAKDNTVTFTQSSTRTNISTGEKLSVLFGKIKKYFADLKTVAFTGSYNDLSDKPAIPTVTNDLTNALKSNYDTAYTHSQSAHAPSNAQKNVQSDWNATSGDALILNKPTIPSEVTESTVSGWGFTKNSGTYSKPSGGIPKTDLASAVQTSLGKADTALQSFTETDPTVPAWAKEANKPTYTASEVGLGNVGNFKAVSTVASQGLTDTEKSNARTNIGAGTSNLALGETSGTAYRGDRGKTAYDHSQATHAPSDAQKNVQSDWNATSGDAFIKNKPTIPSGALANKNTVSESDLSADVQEKLNADPTLRELNKGNKQDFWIGTKAEYDALDTHLSTCMYIITDDIDNVRYATEQFVYEHITNKNNPHNVSALQIGAVQQETFANHTSASNPHGITPDKIGAVSNTAFSGHTNNQNNPHNVTASQIGATTLVDFNSHANNTNNPHNITAEQIGASTSRIFASTVLPTSSDGNNGDLWVVYEE